MLNRGVMGSLVLGLEGGGMSRKLPSQSFFCEYLSLNFDALLSCLDGRHGSAVDDVFRAGDRSGAC
jgi:hypothetical protein